MRRVPVVLALSALAVSSAVYAGTGARPRAADLVLAIGPDTDAGSCNAEDDSTCELVRVRLDLGPTPKATAVRTLVGKDEVGAPGSSAVEPALSPDGSRLAWIERAGRSWQLWARQLGDDAPHLLVKSGPVKEGGAGYKPEWPAWLGNDTLLFDAKTAEADGVELKTIFSMSVASLASPGKPEARFGAGAGDVGLQDVNVRMTEGGAEAVSFGPSTAGSRETYSLDVRTLDRKGRPVGAPLTVPRGLAKSGASLEACHHPAWNASGTGLLCQAHRPAEAVDGINTKLLYRYSRDGNRWSNAGRAFEPLSPRAAGLDAAPLLGPDAGCTTLTYKYGEYCKSDEWILTTLYCARGASGKGRGADVGASRVLLVHTDPVEYIDITRVVEQEKGLKVGALSAFTGTCRELQ